MSLSNNNALMITTKDSTVTGTRVVLQTSASGLRVSTAQSGACYYTQTIDRSIFRIVRIR
jgi:hypothetical protein